VTLLEFAAARRAAGHPTAAVVGRYRLSAGHPAANPPRDRWDKQTDGQTDAVPCLCGVQSLSRLCGSAVDVDTVSSTNQRLDVLEQSIARMSSQAEQHGAVQQVRATSPRRCVQQHIARALFIPGIFPQTYNSPPQTAAKLCTIVNW